jgi:hypothetical protein|nr:hypothetical protein [uncultured Mediterranean phage uvMED]|tara:strand:- start:700 stop:936 length:237 start_codon:yes stop_codon:yes gene_type:complete
MVRYNQESNIYDTIYENRDITVEYDFTSSELDHFVGTGTFDGVTINRIFEDNIDITNNFTQEDLEFLKDEIFNYHINK